MREQLAKYNQVIASIWAESTNNNKKSQGKATALSLPQLELKV